MLSNRNYQGRHLLICNRKLAFSGAIFVAVAINVNGWAALGKSVAGSPKSEPVAADANRKPGWVFETVTKDLGLCKYYVTADGLRIEYPMFVMFADSHKSMVTIGSWETQKSFTFPMDKTRYYLKLMGFTTYDRKDSEFARDYKQTGWIKSRDLLIGELPATEYERHVLNPPLGRTRTEHQILAHISLLPTRFYTFYNNLVSANPAQLDAIVIGDKIEITNPPGGWTIFNTKKARKTMLSSAEAHFPKGFQPVGTVSEMLLNESKPMSIDRERLKEKLKEVESGAKK